MNKYPMGNKGPFHLGFFAAITIEGENIVLNLNNKTIKQINFIIFNKILC